MHGPVHSKHPRRILDDRRLTSAAGQHSTPSASSLASGSSTLTPTIPRSKPVPRAGWVSVLLLEALLEQCNHPAQKGSPESPAWRASRRRPIVLFQACVWAGWRHRNAIGNGRSTRLGGGPITHLVQPAHPLRDHGHRRLDGSFAVEIEGLPAAALERVAGAVVVRPERQSRFHRVCFPNTPPSSTRVCPPPSSTRVCARAGPARVRVGAG